MCGITGFAAAPGRPTLSEARLRAMAEAIAHRGPDGDGFHIRDGIALAQRRLAIIDVAGGDNPLLDPAGRAALMYNGEVWNHLALRRELEAAGCRPRTGSDGEVVLHGILTWGFEQTLRRLRGMYAFALHDFATGELHLARDPFGIKPMFVRETPEGLAFGSEIKAVLAAGGSSPRLDRRGLLQCATLGFTLSPRTAFEGVVSLPPGHAMTWRAGKARSFRYHELRWEPGRERADADELWRRLSDAVESHLMSEVPLGAFLSGGVDSSAIVAAMAGRTRGTQAVCVGILQPGMDERPHAREVAAALEVRLHEETAAPRLLDLLPRLVRHLEQPFGDTSAAPTFLVCQAARRHVTVALSGDGGDENFAGYRRIRYDVLEQRWRARLPAALRRGVLGPLGRAWPRGTWLPGPLRAGTLLTNLGDDWLGSYVRSMSRITEEQARALLVPEATDPLPLRADFEPHAARVQDLDPLHRVLAMDFATWLPDDILVKADRMSMAHGLEVRVPLLDTDFVEWCAGLPAEARLEGGQGKALFRRALAGRVPDTTLSRRKQGFHLPVGEWLRGELRSKLEELLADERAPVFRVLRRAPVERLARRHLSGAHDHATELWFALSLQAFLQEFPGVRLKLLVYTMLFPSAGMPHHGVFVRERLWRWRERHGGELAVVAPVPARRAWRDVPAAETDAGTSVLHPRFASPPMIGDAWRAALMARGTREALLAEARRSQPDVLDAHFAWPDGAAAATLRPELEAALGRRLPLVITARGTDLNLSAQSPGIRRRLAAALARADHVVCVAEALRREALALGLPEDRVTTLRNGVDGRRFTPGDRAAARAELALPADRAILLVVGHLVARKGQQLLLEALAAAYPAGRRPLLVLVGRGPDERALRAQAARLGLAQDVQFAGVVHPERLPTWYRAADALVLPSLREGWPNVLLEALACGTPVLATAVWGTPEVLTGCRAGLLVEPTVAGLTDGLRRLQELDRSTARPWAEAHSWDATLDGLQALYERLVRDARA